MEDSQSFESFQRVRFLDTCENEISSMPVANIPNSLAEYLFELGFYLGIINIVFIANH